MANLPTGASLANGNKRNNRAKAQVDGRFNSAFNEGQNMANRQHPTATNKQGQHHTTDDGKRS